MVSVSTCCPVLQTTARWRTPHVRPKRMAIIRPAVSGHQQRCSDTLWDYEPLRRAGWRRRDAPCPLHVQKVSMEQKECPRARERASARETSRNAASLLHAGKVKESIERSCQAQSKHLDSRECVVVLSSACKHARAWRVYPRKSPNPLLLHAQRAPMRADGVGCIPGGSSSRSQTSTVCAWICFCSFTQTCRTGRTGSLFPFLRPNPPRSR